MQQFTFNEIGSTHFMFLSIYDIKHNSSITRITDLPLQLAIKEFPFIQHGSE